MLLAPKAGSALPVWLGADARPSRKSGAVARELAWQRSAPKLYRFWSVYYCSVSPAAPRAGRPASASAQNGHQGDGQPRAGAHLSLSKQGGMRSRLCWRAHRNSRHAASLSTYAQQG